MEARAKTSPTYITAKPFSENDYVTKSYTLQNIQGVFNLKKQIIKHQKTSKPKIEKKACGIREKAFEKLLENMIYQITKLKRKI